MGGAFAKSGCNLVLAARGEAALESAVARCKTLRANAVGIPADVSDYAQLQELASRALPLPGKIDFWVNNAGVMASGRFEEIPIEVSHHVVLTNVFGYVNGAHMVIPISSSKAMAYSSTVFPLAGLGRRPIIAVCSATKFGIKGRMECFIHPRNISFPGAVNFDEVIFI